MFIRLPNTAMNVIGNQPPYDSLRVVDEMSEEFTRLIVFRKCRGNNAPMLSS